MISNFKLFPNVNISQNFVQNVPKQKKKLCPELLPPMCIQTIKKESCKSALCLIYNYLGYEQITTNDFCDRYVENM